MCLTTRRSIRRLLFPWSFLFLLLMASMSTINLNLYPNSSLIRCQHQRKHHACHVHLRTASDRKGSSDVKHTTVSWIVPITSHPPFVHIRHRRNCVENYDGTSVPTVRLLLNPSVFLNMAIVFLLLLLDQIQHKALLAPSLQISIILFF